MNAKQTGYSPPAVSEERIERCNEAFERMRRAMPSGVEIHMGRDVFLELLFSLWMPGYRNPHSDARLARMCEHVIDAIPISDQDRTAAKIELGLRVWSGPVCHAGERFEFGMTGFDVFRMDPDA